MNTTNGTAFGVNWTKTQPVQLDKGFTTVITDGEEVTFYGHTSNSRAFTYISKMLKQRGVTVVNGQIITKAGK